MVAVPQTVFIHSLGPNFRRYLTEDFLAITYPVRSMIEAGLVVALSSDAPVVPDDDPLLGIQAAVSEARSWRVSSSRPKSRSTSVERSLRLYDGRSDRERRRGRIAGASLRGNGRIWSSSTATPRRRVARGDLPEISVRQTFVAGRAVYEA